MVSFFRAYNLQPSRRVTAMILASSFLIGLFMGSFTAVCTDISRFSMMRTALDLRVSIVGLLPILLLPFLFSAFAVYISQIWLLVPIAFFKAFFFSYLGAVFLILYPDSGWLLRMLFLFADCFTLPVLCWYWIRACCSFTGADLRSGVLVFLLISAIGCLDTNFISPFLASLLS